MYFCPYIFEHFRMVWYGLTLYFSNLNYKLPYFSGEYKMMDDGEERHSVYVEKYDRVLEEGEFSMNGE